MDSTLIPCGVSAEPGVPVVLDPIRTDVNGQCMTVRLGSTRPLHRRQRSRLPIDTFDTKRQAIAVSAALLHRIHFAAFALWQGVLLALLGTLSG